MGRLAEHVYSDLGAALQAATAGLAPDAVIAVIPEGPYVYARVP
jgi:hypothetical protein